MVKLTDEEVQFLGECYQKIKSCHTLYRVYPTFEKYVDEYMISRLALIKSVYFKSMGRLYGR